MCIFKNKGESIWFGWFAYLCIFLGCLRLTEEKEKDKRVSRNDMSCVFTDILLLSIGEGAMTASVCFE